MATFIHKGRSIYFREYGRGEPLLLIHGLGSSGADWGLQLPVLEKRFRVIVPDLPGSGRSQSPREEYSIAGFASALWALLDQLKIDRVNLVGFSMGGAVGFEMSLQRPDGVHRLGLINSLATYRLDHWSKWLEARIPALLVPLIGMERMARLAAGRLFPRPWQRPLREAAAAVISAVPATSYLGMGLALQQWSAVDRLHRLKCKILLIAAEHDYTPLAEKRDLAARLRAPIIVVRGSRHATPFDSVALTNASLLALLTDRPLPPAEEHICDTPAAVAALASPGAIYPSAPSCVAQESPAN
jgi:pimeloyl-ACP methyl ester carboxylesterase